MGDVGVPDLQVGKACYAAPAAKSYLRVSSYHQLWIVGCVLCCGACEV